MQERYLHEVAKSEGVNIETINLYIHSVSGFAVSIKEALLARSALTDIRPAKTEFYF